MKPNIPPVLVIFALICFALVQSTQAVSPPPDGGYPGGNTAEGDNALLSLSSGFYNTAVGLDSLLSVTDGSFCTGIGAGTLLSNTGNENTATGAGALLSNTTAARNTANGAFALFNNTLGFANTAIGDRALLSNITGTLNTAVGVDALHSNTADGNTAIGTDALFNNSTGVENTAVGTGALTSNVTTGANTAVGFHALLNNQKDFCTAVGDRALENSNNSWNTAVGYEALNGNISGDHNTAVGIGALFANQTSGDNTGIGGDALENNTGAANTAVGRQAGFNQTNGSFNVYIGQGMEGVAGEIGHTYIRNINLTNVSGGGTDTVTVDLTTGLLGHLTSSRRYKEDIRPMNNVSEKLYRLKPVSYRYKKQIDPTQSPAFGLIAEEVAEVDPDLVARNAKGQPESVHYEMVNAMLLNEFLKEHRKNEEQQATIAQLKSGMEALTATVKEQAAQIQKVSAQLEASRSAPQVANSNY